MSDAIQTPPLAVNEPVRDYEPKSADRKDVKAALAHQAKTPVVVPLIISGQKIEDRRTEKVFAPHDHKLHLADVAQATADDVKGAIEGALKARKKWAALPWQDRASIFLKAADLLAGPYRAKMNAATMLGQSKTIYQAEIDAVCELADFWRFNVRYLREIMEDQPESAPGVWNRTAYRGLEGFVLAISPFNFTSIDLNLASAPALMGCSVVWKPASTSALASYVGLEILLEAGLPPDVISFIPGDAAMIGDQALSHPELAGVHFTGSTKTFNHIWKTVGNQVDTYRYYPRVVGETGGKDFIFAHPSADVASLVVAMVRGAFEYQGQKCSAASRAYIPRSLWSDLKPKLTAMVAKLTMGEITDFTNFMGAVIDQSAYRKITGYIELAKSNADAEIIAGGEFDDAKGYFIRPTVIEAKTPSFTTMVEEIFGPVLTVFVYDDQDLEKTLDLCDQGSPYALTGAIFGQDRYALNHMANRLEHAAGNFYINDKPTGAVVGQQPFGGGRASGTNDKAGSKLNLLRWTSVRTIKENFCPPTDYRYRHMEES